MRGPTTLANTLEDAIVDLIEMIECDIVAGATSETRCGKTETIKSVMNEHNGRTPRLKRCGG